MNPGHRYLGVAVFHGTELREWSVKSFRSLSLDDAIVRVEQMLSEYVARYGIRILALKALHPSRSSVMLQKIIAAMRVFGKSGKLRVVEYSLEDVKRTMFANERANKVRIMKSVTERYPFLFREYEKECCHKQPYFFRMFEAVAVGITCLAKLDGMDEKVGSRESSIR